jgi:hypothetical protein
MAPSGGIRRFRESSARKPREIVVPLSLEPRDLETGVVLRIAFQMPVAEEDGSDLEAAA